MRTVTTNKVAKAIGPYSPAVITNGLIFCAGQIGVTPEDILTNGIENQTRQALNNIQSILQECGANLQNIVKITVFLKDLEDFSTINNIYAEIFGKHKPARTTVQITKLPKDALIEIEAIAEVPKS